jgi:hypothetical protein
MAEDHAADRAHEEGSREDGEGRKQGDEVVGRGEEVLPKMAAKPKFRPVFLSTS